MKENQIKGSKVFSEQIQQEPQANLDLDEQNQEQINESAIKGAKSFNELDIVETINPKEELLDSDEFTSALDNAFKEPVSVQSSKSWSMLAKLSVVAFVVFVIVQTLLGLIDAFNTSPWLFAFYSCVFGVIGAWCGTIVFKEWRKLKALKHVATEQATSERLTHSLQMGEAEPFISSLLSKYPNNEAKKHYLSVRSDEHNDAEKLTLFEDIILSDRDKAAKQCVARYSAEAALLLAASPLAALDMALILWRNQAMLTKISTIYGIELGYWSRIKLIRAIIVNIIYAGATEIVTDVGTQLLSVEVTGKLSTRIAQGLGGGLLTARLGYQAMALCRPKAFTKDNKPKLSQIHQQLLTEIKGLTTAAMAKSKVAKSELDKEKVR